MTFKADEELIREIQAGNIASYEEVVLRYQQRLFRFVLRFVFDEHDAEEVVQDTLFTVYTHIDSINSKQKFSSYLFTIAKNTAISLLRSKKKTVSLEDIEVAQDDESLYDQLTQQDQQQQISKLLSKIDEKYSSILKLYYVEDLSYEEISHKTKLPLNTVRTRLRRAKEEIKKVIKL